MNIKHLMTVAAISICLPAMAQWGGSQVKSTVINADNTVTFNYQSATAKDVKVSVQFAGEKQMKKGDNGVWSVTLGPAEPDMYPYCFIVDGVSVMDSQNPDWFPNEGFKNSILDIRGDKELIHALKNVPHGSVDYISYFSKSINGWNNAIVYTPPFYDQNPGKKYPVFYLISGTTDTEEVYHKVGRVNFILDNLIAEGKAKEMIVVLPYGNPTNLFKGLPQKSPAGGMMNMFQDKFSTDLNDDLMPFVESHYRTINDRNSRAIGGFSRGGNQGLANGLSHLDKFSWLCSYSSFTQTNIPGVYDNAEETNKKINLFWLGVGTDDFLYGNAKDYMDFLDSKGIKTVKEFTTDKFGHTWMNAKYFLSKSLPLLFQDKKDRKELSNPEKKTAPAIAKEDGQFLTPEVMARTFPRGVTSPEYNTDGTVTFRFLADNAQSVQLDCQMFGERKQMTKDEQGTWTITVKPEVPDIYPYCFIVDGMQVTDPQNMYIFPNEGFKNSLADVRAAAPTMQDIQDVPHGKISYRYYHSDLGFDRPMCVYTPAGYNPADKTKYPVLYLIHGMTDTYETWWKVGRANVILDNLIAQGKAEKMIVVMPYANPYPEMQLRKLTDRYDPMNTDIVVKEIVNNVMPFIEKNYNVKADADHRAVAGFSLGGRQTLATGLGHPELFHYVCAFSSAIFGGEWDRNFESGTYAKPELIKKEMKYLWVSCGKADGLCNGTQGIDKALTDKGITHTAHYSEGGHTWMNCRDYLEAIAQKLFK